MLNIYLYIHTDTYTYIYMLIYTYVYAMYMSVCIPVPSIILISYSWVLFNPSSYGSGTIGGRECGESKEQCEGNCTKVCVMITKDKDQIKCFLLAQR